MRESSFRSKENIQKTVADFDKIKVADMCSKKRPASIARQMAMHLADDITCLNRADATSPSVNTSAEGNVLLPSGRDDLALY